MNFACALRKTANTGNGSRQTAVWIRRRAPLRALRCGDHAPVPERGAVRVMGRVVAAAIRPRTPSLLDRAAEPHCGQREDLSGADEIVEGDVLVDRVRLGDRAGAEGDGRGPGSGEGRAVEPGRARGDRSAQ